MKLLEGNTVGIDLGTFFTFGIGKPNPFGKRGRFDFPVVAVAIDLGNVAAKSVCPDGFVGSV